MGRVTARKNDIRGISATSLFHYTSQTVDVPINVFAQRLCLPNSVGVAAVSFRRSDPPWIAFPETLQTVKYYRAFERYCSGEIILRGRGIKLRRGDVESREDV